MEKYVHEYTDHYWLVDDYGRLEIYGGLAEGPTYLTVRSTKPVVASRLDRVRGVLTLTTSDGGTWEVSSQVIATTPTASWLGSELARETALERKMALKRGELDNPRRHVLIVGMEAGSLPEKAVFRLRDLLDAPVSLGCRETAWCRGPADEAVVANGELLEQLAERYDAIAGEIPAVVLEALCAKARQCDWPVGPAGKPLRIYTVVTRDDGKRRWARVG